LKAALETIADIPGKCKAETETCEVKQPSCSTCGGEKPAKGSKKESKAAVKAVEKMEEKAEKKEALKETKKAVH
jgi:hypothetical protein